MRWLVRGRFLELGQKAQVMGVLNVTPDSFSDGGKFLDPAAALVQAKRMVEQGASIIDVGGESSRPGAEPISSQEELRRVLPVIEQLRAALPDIDLSIDTYKAEVAHQALQAGADIVNDISAAQDQKMASIVRDFGAGIILMHMQGRPKSMQQNPVYEDVSRQVLQFFKHRRDYLLSEGIAEEQIALDPGFGFGKRLEHNLALAQHLDLFTQLGRPIVVGISRKSTLGQLLGPSGQSPSDRVWATVAFTSFLREKGARIIRVHDVQPNLEALRMTEAILSDD
jgi:dihydropteroate synthase